MLKNRSVKIETVDPLPVTLPKPRMKESEPIPVPKPKPSRNLESPPIEATPETDSYYFPLTLDDVTKLDESLPSDKVLREEIVNMS